MGRVGAAAGIVVGAGTIFLWRGLRNACEAAAARVQDVGASGLDEQLASWSTFFSLYELLPGFMLSMLAIVLATWCWPGRGEAGVLTADGR